MMAPGLAADGCRHANSALAVRLAARARGAWLTALARWCSRAAVLAAALAAGVAGGAVHGAAAQPMPRMFSADVGLIFSYVQADRSEDFENIMTRVGEALAASEQVDRRRQAAGWTLYRAEELFAGGAVLYISVLDPVVPDADYWVPRILNEAFPTEVQALYDTYAGAFADGQMILNLTRVDLEPAAGGA